MRRSKKNYKAREIFFAHNGVGPYLCFRCDAFVLFDEVHVHHADEDECNNNPTNLVAAHCSCHTSFHQQGERNSAKGEEARKKMSAARLGRPLSPSHRKNVEIGKARAREERKRRDIPNAAG